MNGGIKPWNKMDKDRRALMISRVLSERYIPCKNWCPHRPHSHRRSEKGASTQRCDPCGTRARTQHNIPARPPAHKYNNSTCGTRIAIKNVNKLGTATARCILNKVAVSIPVLSLKVVPSERVRAHLLLHTLLRLIYHMAIILGLYRLA